MLKKNGGGRVAAHEIMIGIPAIRNLIRENKVAQMYSAIQTGANYGMTTLDQSLEKLGFTKGVIISTQSARTAAKQPESFL
jgi:twitching motility protein PilT